MKKRIGCWPCFYRLGHKSPRLRLFDEDELTELVGVLVCPECRDLYEPRLKELAE